MQHIVRLDYLLMWKYFGNVRHTVASRYAAVNTALYRKISTARRSHKHGVHRVDNLGVFEFELGGSIPNLTISWEEVHSYRAIFPR